MVMEDFYINFDFRKDTKCGDADTDSKKLYAVQKFLWSKTLPCGRFFDIDVFGNSRLLLKSKICDNLSSDRMCPHFDEKYDTKISSWLSEEEKEELKYKVRTIGGHIVFPAHMKNGFTINQSRGVNRKICDRFDLTLECIKRFYLGKESVLFSTFERYKDFFDLFIDFKGYVDFFLLQDFVNDKYEINFSLPFDNFERSPLPLTKEEYQRYKNHTIELIDKRNNRILKYINDKK